MTDKDIIYEDNHIIVVNKPAGIAVQAAQPNERDLLQEVKDFIKKRDAKPGNVFVGLVHRIDRPVSGIVLFAKTSKGASRLSEQIRAGTIDKTYEAVVHGVIQDNEGTLEHRLDKVQRRAGGYKAVVTQYGGSIARLRYTVTERAKDVTKVRIDLETGRFHQIRIQMATSGHTIVGDTLYGAKERLPDNAIMLRAVSVAFNHPTTNERIELAVPGFSFPPILSKTP